MSKSNKSQKIKQDSSKPKSSDKKQKEFGLEGTNKTIPKPKPDDSPSEELDGKSDAPQVGGTPFTRG